MIYLGFNLGPWEICKSTQNSGFVLKDGSINNFIRFAIGPTRLTSDNKQGHMTTL